MKGPNGPGSPERRTPVVTSLSRAEDQAARGGPVAASRHGPRIVLRWWSHVCAHNLPDCRRNYTGEWSLGFYDGAAVENGQIYLGSPGEPWTSMPATAP